MPPPCAGDSPCAGKSKHDSPCAGGGEPGKGRTKGTGMGGKGMRGNAEAVESTAVAMAKADHERPVEEVARTKARLQQARDRHEIAKRA